jgi:two-component system sensor histidine kinase DesK
MSTSIGRALGGEGALGRMRRYTTLSMVLLVVFFVFLVAVALEPVPLRIAIVVAGALACAYCVYWEQEAPLWLSIATIALTYAVWCWSVFERVAPLPAILFAIAAAIPISKLRRHRTVASAASIALTMVPIVVASIVIPSDDWIQWVIGGVAGQAAALSAFFLNRYAWNLYLEIDTARQTSAQLAVAQERYRFAADLHDIQGHTLHVLRLKTQLAAKLLERDPTTALEHLREADALIGETLANTRSLAFGERHVSLASEVANARELFEAAGISWHVDGAVPPAGPHEELLGLVMREATTNILRHAQATSVRVSVGPNRLVVINDGSPATTRALSGLARLAERFEAVGGTLRTTASSGSFTTEASIP